MHLKEEKMHKHFCKICNTPAPMGAVTNPTIIFIDVSDYSNSLTVHFDCIDKEIVGQWNSISVPQVFQGTPIKSIISTHCGKPGIYISRSDFTVLEEAWEQDGIKGVTFKKVVANVLTQKILSGRQPGNTEAETPIMSRLEIGAEIVPLAANA